MLHFLPSNVKTADELISHTRAIRNKFYPEQIRPIMVRRVPPFRQIYSEPIGPLPEIKFQPVTAAFVQPMQASPSGIPLAHEVGAAVSMIRARWIIRDCCMEFGVTRDQIMSRRRNANIVEARHMAMWRMYKELGWTMERIGKFLGGFDHSVCVHAIRKIDARLAGLAR
jgi:hypothetical protein